ncbi:MAG: hypothetical protein CMJ23_04505 [Phycisphaerae bacterium]|nr:hypothetical protein [Phycisphaerae bacterium]
MPPEAGTGTLTRWVLENPWPLSIALLLLAAAILIHAIRRDDRRPIRFAVGVFVLAIGCLATGLLVETRGESAEESTRKLVAAAVDGRIEDMIDLFEPEATLHVGRVETPGYPRSELERNLEALRSRQRIEENMVTRLDSANGREDSVWIDLACMTRTNGSGGWVPSRWILEWRINDTTEPRIRSITLLNLAGRTPRDARFLR